MPLPLPDFTQLARRLKAGSNIVMHSDFAEPGFLARQLVQHAALFQGVKLHTLMPMGQPPYATEEVASHLTLESFFPGGGLRKAVSNGWVKPRRCTLSQIPEFFRQGEIIADMVLLQVSVANAAGEVSLGVSVDYMREVLAQNPIVVAQINPQMPFTFGDAVIPLSCIDYAVEVDEPLLAFPSSVADDVDSRIARHVASLIDDGDVVQAGIGALPDAVLANLGHLKNLGAHTGILTGAWMPLIKNGVVDNSTKTTYPGMTITTMAGGDQAFYRFLDDNPTIQFLPCSITHSHSVLAATDRLCAINSVLQMDLAGNANAESVNGRLISTPGGLPDFAHGASQSSGGKSIIALRSSFKNGEISNIVCRLSNDVPVTLTQNDIGFVVTEYGIADLSGLDAVARAKALINIAHPEHQQLLERQWHAAN